MNRYILIAFSLCISSLIFAQKKNDDFTGRWKAPKGAIIIVSKSNNSFIGKTELEDVVVLEDIRFFKGKWTAVVLNPKEHLIAKCELKLEQNKLKIIVRKGILHKTITWIKQ